VQEWDEYLDAYAQHLAVVKESLISGRVFPITFDRPRPSTKMPARLKEKAEHLLAETEALSREIETRMRVVNTVLRYSRMKDPEKVVLIDVIA
jgi:hypothetical protein